MRVIPLSGPEPRVNTLSDQEALASLWPTVTIWALPSLSSVYQVIVEEERPRRLRRELGVQECFPIPLTFEAALARGLVHYFGAELVASSLPEAMPFTVGDNQTYRGFWNPPLEPRKSYLIYFQAASHLKGVRTRSIMCWRLGWQMAGAGHQVVQVPGFAPGISPPPPDPSFPDSFSVPIPSPVLATPVISVTSSPGVISGPGLHLFRPRLHLLPRPRPVLQAPPSLDLFSVFSLS